MKKQDVALQLALLFVAAFFTMALVGCSSRNQDRGESSPTAEEEHREVASDSASLEPKETSSNDSETLQEAIRALGQTTSQFTGVFSEEDENEETVDSQEDVGIDVSLVDEETRRKYSDDRSLIAPTLDKDKSAPSDSPRFRLEYKFKPNSNLAWNVVHLVRKRVSYSGVEKLIETSSTTWRRWEFLDALDDGRVQARHWIDRMVLEQHEEGKDPINYDSERDVVVPREIAAFGTEKAVGVALETFSINPLGVMSDKTKLVAEYQGREGDSSVMAPFPDSELAVGDVWTIPYTLYLKGSDDIPHPCRIVEIFRLEKIDEKFATISFKTTLVSIVDDPVVEGALAERLFTGRVLFDRELGLATRTELNFKKSVPRAFGFASFLEYDCQVTEKLDRAKSGLDDSPSSQETDENLEASVPDESSETEGEQSSSDEVGVFFHEGQYLNLERTTVLCRDARNAKECEVDA